MTDTEMPVAPPRTGLLLVTEMVGPLAFAADAGAASGIRTRSPENARKTRISPELNFVIYAFVGVFNFSSGSAL